jgi:hypothetical protein
MVVGIAPGAVLGALPLQGNIGWLVGAAIGLSSGLIVASIADDLGRKPAYTLGGIAAGAALGAVAGLLLDRVLLSNGHPALGLWVGGALGLVIGTVIDVRTDT